MTWFWSPCLREPETERYKLCQDNRVWGRGGKPFSRTKFWWAWFRQHSGGQHFGLSECAGRCEARENNCIYWASWGPIYWNWQPFLEKDHMEDSAQAISKFCGQRETGKCFQKHKSGLLWNKVAGHKFCYFTKIANTFCNRSQENKQKLV